MPTRVALSILLSILLTLVVLRRDARADEAAAVTKQQCVAASEKAQQLKNAGKLEAARGELQICGRAECPKLIQQDCTEWMKDILGILPTVVLAAKDRRGRDLIDVKVSVDGKVVAETLDGKAVSVDPGVHVFHFEGKGAGAGTAADEQVVIRQGEKNRIVTTTLLVPEDEKTTPVAPPSTSTTTKSSSSPPIAAFIVGGAGLVALGIGGYLILDANMDAGDLRETCAPNCKEDDVKSIEDRRIIGGITAGVGGALLVVGVILFFTHSSGSGSASTKSAQSKPSLTQTVASAWLQGIRF